VALSDLAVFSEYAYQAMTETVTQQIELFNAASRNTIMLSSAFHQGDYSEEAFFKKISGLVRRRNAYGSGTVAAKDLQHLTDTMVKVAAGTPPVNVPPGQFNWIKMNPETAGAAMGQQLAGDLMADMLNTAIMGAQAALSGQAALIYDATADTTKTLNARALNKGAGKFGDRSSDIAAWVVHSTPLTDFHDNALQNSEQLFTYGTVNVMSDPFGRVFVISDVPSLVVTGTPNVYYTMDPVFR
jgi:hypothetical protein